jgi:NAD(P)-dependent dehydrogenase (short-subunit alcohol dehydrogenase family)
MSRRRPVALITGAAGGLGRATVEYLVARGWSVVAADLPSARLDDLGTRPFVRAVAMDVTDRGSVEAGVADLERLDAVVTFAGVLRVGSVAEIDEPDLRLVVDVNLLGTIRVVRACFDRLVDSGGRVVVISSETGWQTAAPFNGAYALSKHAVEAYADALRREAALVGVSVVKVQPGPFRTEMVGGIATAFERAAAASTHFGDLLPTVGALAARENEDAADPAILAAAVHRALTARRPRIAYSVRPDRARSSLEWLPTRAADRLITTGLSWLRRNPRA